MKLNLNCYVITAYDHRNRYARSMYRNSHYPYRYINFDRNKVASPKIVTAVGHSAKYQVYFENKKQANDFLDTFEDYGDRARYNFEVKEYQGKYKDAEIEKVNTVYGVCYRIKNAKELI